MREASMIIAIVSAKGGTGKSTITLNLAGILCSLNQKVLVVDADPQGSIAQWSKKTIQKKPEVLVETSPADNKKLKKIARKYDYVLFDSPPTFRKRIRTVMRLADMLIVPVCPGMADLWSTEKLLEVFFEEKRKRARLDTRLLISRVDRRTRQGREFRDQLERLNIPIFLTEIPQRAIYNEIWLQCVTIDILQPHGDGAKEFHNLAREIIIWTAKKQLL